MPACEKSGHLQDIWCAPTYSINRYYTYVLDLYEALTRAQSSGFLPVEHVFNMAIYGQDKRPIP